MARGMNPAKVAQWTACLARFREAGLTVARFCETEGVSPPSFYQWRRKLAGETKMGRTVRRVGKPKQEKEPVGASGGSASRSRATSVPAFQAIEVLPANAAATIRLPGGVEIELGSDLRAFDLLLGRLLDRAASDRAASDGAASDGAASDGAASDGAASDGATGGKEGQRC